MAKVHFVKSACKDNPVVKKGESYYWWKLNRFTPKQYSVTPPKRSQLHSGFIGQFYEIIESMGIMFTDFDTFEDDLSFLKDQFQELIDQCQDSLDNMPEHLQESSPTGELLSERISVIEQALDDLESIDIPEYDSKYDGEESAWKEKKLGELQEEVQNAIPEF